MVEWAVVDWADRVAPFEELDRLDGDGCEFYAMVSAVPMPERTREWKKPFQLLYIGLAYHQSVEKRIRQDHQSYDLLCRYIMEHKRERDVLVMLGRLHVYSPERVTKEFVEDIEALLIHENKPQFNKRHKNRYNGRPLVVVRHPWREDEEPGYEPIMRLAASSERAFTMWLDGPTGHELMQRLLEIGPISR